METAVVRGGTAAIEAIGICATEGGVVVGGAKGGGVTVGGTSRGGW